MLLKRNFQKEPKFRYGRLVQQAFLKCTQTPLWECYLSKKSILFKGENNILLQKEVKYIFTNKYIRPFVYPSLLFIGMTILNIYEDNEIQWGDNLFLFLFTLVFYNLILFLLKRFKETPPSK